MRLLRSAGLLCAMLAVASPALPHADELPEICQAPAETLDPSGPLVPLPDDSHPPLSACHPHD